jgi:hypothetical protein
MRLQLHPTLCSPQRRRMALLQRVCRQKIQRGCPLINVSISEESTRNLLVVVVVRVPSSPSTITSSSQLLRNAEKAGQRKKCGRYERFLESHPEREAQPAAGSAGFSSRSSRWEALLRGIRPDACSGAATSGAFRRTLTRRRPRSRTGGTSCTSGPYETSTCSERAAPRHLLPRAP